MEEKLIYLKLNQIKPYENNAKIHDQQQIDMIKKSIEEFGFTNPLLVTEDYKLIAGHGRLIASEQLGMTELPCRVIKGLTDEQYRALVLADNKITELGSWDIEKLNLEIENINIEMEDFGFIKVSDFSFNDDDFLKDTEITKSRTKTIECPNCHEIIEI